MLLFSQKYTNEEDNALIQPDDNDDVIIWLGDDIDVTIWLNDNMVLPSGWMVTFSLIFGVNIWMDDSVTCYHQADFSIWSHHLAG